jgi:hypothetical protein
MVRARNLITNNLSNAYAVGAVSLRGETHVESAYLLARLPYVVRYIPAKYTTKYRKAITTLVCSRHNYGTSICVHGLSEISCYIKPKSYLKGIHLNIYANQNFDNQIFEEVRVEK